MIENVSLTRLHQYERGTISSSYIRFEIVLFVAIVGMLMVALGVGANVYRSISAQHWADEQSRTGLALVANSVHITDEIDAVGVGAGPEGQALVLTERFADAAYETRIYLYEGNVVEEYAVAGAPYAPDRATPIIESDTFSFSYANDLLSVFTDHGTQQIMLHSVRRTGTPPVGAGVRDQGDQGGDAGEAAEGDQGDQGDQGAESSQGGQGDQGDQGGDSLAG